MIDALRSEFRKLFTVRSTYILLLFLLVLDVFFSFFITGFHISQQDLNSPSTLAGEATSAIGVMGVLIAIAGLLLVTHEYRYNTITYSLTAAKSRSRVLIGKIVVISGFAVVAGLIFGWLAPLLASVGIQAHGQNLVPQDISVWSVTWRIAFGAWGFSMFGLLFAMLFRNQIATFVALFIWPTTVEPLFRLLLKEDYVYLPFTVLGQVFSHEYVGTHGQRLSHAALSYGQAALWFLAYLVVGWIVAWILFLRRDAN